MLTREELAKAVLHLLATQKRYFSARSNAVLEESKKLERELKHACERITEGDTLPFGDDE